MEERMTVCNMSIEAGARAGLIAPDDDDVRLSQGSPARAAGRGVGRGGRDAGSARSPTPTRSFDREVDIDAPKISPSVTYGTHPGMVDHARCAGAGGDERAGAARAGLHATSRRASRWRARRSTSCFVGSCTNSRLSDLRAAADVLRGRRIAARVRMLVVPGSEQVKRDAESEGLHEVFTRGRRRVARAGLLDVPRHERRHRQAGPARRQHQQSQLRRPPGPGRAHGAGQSAGRRRVGAGRQHRRSARTSFSEAPHESR